MRFEEAFYGSATIGERGQVVIPAEARSDLDLKAGDKILFMRHPLHKGLMAFKIESIREFLDEFAAQVERMEHHAQSIDIDSSDSADRESNESVEEGSTSL
jgi:AbrB family looped-hinge helix DNA binding protein